jgi:hypothetical protein
MSQLHRFPSPEEVVMRYPHLRKNLGHNRPIEDLVIPHELAVKLFSLHVTAALLKTRNKK